MAGVLQDWGKERLHSRGEHTTLDLSAQVVTPLEPEPDLSAGLGGSPIAKTWKQPKCPLTDQWIKKMWYIYTMDYSVQFSCSVMSNYLQPHGLQHTRPPCPSPTPRVYSNSCPLSQ